MVSLTQRFNCQCTAFGRDNLGKAVLQEYKETKLLSKEELDSVEWLLVDATLVDKIKRRIYLQAVPSYIQKGILLVGKFPNPTISLFQWLLVFGKTLEISCVAVTSIFIKNPYRGIKN